MLSLHQLFDSYYINIFKCGDESTELCSMHPGQFVMVHTCTIGRQLTFAHSKYIIYIYIYIYIYNISLYFRFTAQTVFEVSSYEKITP